MFVCYIIFETIFMINIFKASLTEKKQLTADVFLFSFDLINPDKIEFEAGQYLILKVNNQPRLYSIFSSEENKKSMQLLVKIIPDGVASTYLTNLKSGDQVEFQGPAGAFKLQQNRRDKIFLATFTGLAPLYSMITSCLKMEKKLTQPKLYLFWGLRHFSDICLLDELKQLSINNQQFKFFICLSRETDLSKIKDENKKYFKLGRINDVWQKFNSQLIKQCSNVTMKQFINNFDYYLCASRDVVESLKQYLIEKGIAKENIFSEKF